ncbi:MAG TPA: DUF4974 domain-containing protein, partial [Saprospiraceae bacterium]|nr:DUF4974 domain-containing protein [Saprospiraceae bacterium]
LKKALALLQKNDMKISQNYEDNQYISSWKDGTIIFEGAVLSDVLNKITEIYGVEFEVEDQRILNRKITAGIPNSQLEIALTMLQNLLDVDIERIDKSKYNIQ